MSLQYKEEKNGLTTERIIILVLLVALIGFVAYSFTNKTPEPTTSIGQNVAQQPITEQQVAGMEDLEPVRYGMAVGKYDGEIHPLIDILDDLRGFKYDESVAPEDTVYIVYDPRCPYCHQLFDKVSTVNLKEKGITIKWLPTTALGDSEEARKLGAMGLQSKSVQDFAKTFESNVNTSGVVVSADNEDALNENLGFLFEASNQTFGPEFPKSVPAAFFIDKQTGAPNMMYAASEEETFKQIFGE